ncbi:MAG: hypothetical protein QM747_09060 [Nocardioides sp.]
MLRTKFGAALASLAVTAGAATVLAAAPAYADTATTAALAMGGRTGLAAHYGSYIGTFSGGVSDGSNPVTTGAADLEQRLPGKSWKVVKTDQDVSDGVSFGNYGSKARGNVSYRLHYLGGTDGDTATTYSTSYSNTVIIRTGWEMAPHAMCTTKCRFYGKLSPKAKHHKILLQVKHGKSWKRYKVLHTNGHSRWTATVQPSRGKGTYYRAVVGKTKSLIKTYALGHFTIIGKSSYAVSRH